MPSDVIFPTAVRVIRPGATPQILQTVQQAIDWIGSLPEATWQKPCWHMALIDLCDADEVRDIHFLNRAQSSLIRALREERWLQV